MRIDVRNMQPDEKIKVRFGEINTIHGKDGKSAYDYAVDGGYTGTEEEFAYQLANGGTGGIAKETDPTVPEWAKQSEKPTYTAAEVDAYTKAETDEAIAQATLSGERGEDGESAYEIAVRHGFEGTEEEWLDSLNGESITVTSVLQDESDGGYNEVTFSDGTVMLVKNGERGKTGMPGAQGEPGENGKDGESGVYVGANEPDSSANVWINPEGEASTEGVYELIETITVQEEVSRIERNQEPNGAKYNFTKIYVDVKTPAGEAQKNGVISLNADSGVVPVAYLQKLIETNTDGAWGKVYAHIDGNVLRGSCASSINGGSQLVWGNAVSYMRGFGEVGHTNIHHLQISMLSANFPIGSKIEIWGVRA